LMRDARVCVRTRARAGDGGSIRTGGGRSPRDVSARLGLGFAPQDLSLYEELSAVENLTFFGRLYQLAGKDLHERVGWALEFAGLTDRCKDRVKTYSGGMK